MLHSLDTKPQVEILMAIYESPAMVICELQRQRTTNVPERHAITSIYQKFLETGSVGDRAHIGISSITTEGKVQETQQILDNEPVNSVRSAVREANISRVTNPLVVDNSSRSIRPMTNSSHDILSRSVRHKHMIV